MTAAAGLMLYAAVLTWLCPRAFHRMTCAGVTPRLSVGVWLSAITGALIAWFAALCVVVVDVIHAVVDGAAVNFCLDVLGLPEGLPMAARGPTVVAAVGAAAITGLLVRRTVAGYCRMHSDSSDHALAARIIGRPTYRPDVVVVQAERPASYCVAGRTHAIVFTSAAMQALDPRQLAAVLAHEDAHLRGRHHQVLMSLRAIAGALPRLPLFTLGATATWRLLEMCADDAAARRHGTAPLVESLARLAGFPPAAIHLGAADTAIAARVNRLGLQVDGARRWRHQIAQMVTIAATLATPTLISMVCLH